MTRLRAAWADLKRGRNADSYVAMSLAFAFGVLGLLGVLDLRWAVPVLLLCLVPILNLLLGLHDRLPGSAGQELVPSTSWPAEQLEKDWATNTDVLLVGVTLIRTVRSAEPYLAARMKSGRSVRVLVVDPLNSTAMEMTDSRRQYGPADPTGNAQEVAITLAALERIRTTAPNAQLEIRTIAFPISTGVIAFSPGGKSARLYVSLYPFRTGETQPHFVVQRSHGHWFDHFSEELDNLWRAGRPWKSSPPPATSGNA